MTRMASTVVSRVAATLVVAALVAALIIGALVMSRGGPDPFEDAPSVTTDETIDPGRLGGLSDEARDRIKALGIGLGLTDRECEGECGP